MRDELLNIGACLVHATSDIGTENGGDVGEVTGSLAVITEQVSQICIMVIVIYLMDLGSRYSAWLHHPLTESAKYVITPLDASGIFLSLVRFHLWRRSSSTDATLDAMGTRQTRFINAHGGV